MARLAPPPPPLPSAVILCAVVVSYCSRHSSSVVAAADLVLSEKIMKLVRASAELSILVYSEDPNAEYRGSAFGRFGFWDEEPDQSIVARFDYDGGDYCIGAFRGTTNSRDDWFQNFDLGTESVCDGNGDCCRTRQGFYKAYFTHYVKDFEASLRDCAKDCHNPDECVVLTGHSQGGGIAAVAGVVLADLNPYVFTFGQPRTILAPCAAVQSDRWIRFVNTKQSPAFGIVYDPIPFVPGLGADAFGHMVLLSDDATGVAYIGRDAHEFFYPPDPAGMADAHSMGGGYWGQEYPGYLDRIKALMEGGNATTFPIRNNGYVAGSICSKDKECQTGKCAKETAVAWSRCVGVQCSNDSDCDTGRCDSGVCIPKRGSCMRCDEDSDCAGPSCYLFRCTNEEDRMDDNCVCAVGPDCQSGRCEGLFPPICEATLVNGVKCNEDSDCMSGVCSWEFRCVAEDYADKHYHGMDHTSSDSSAKLFRGGLAALVVLLLLIVGYFGGRRLLRRRRGYQEVPTNTTD